MNAETVPVNKTVCPVCGEGVLESRLVTERFDYGEGEDKVPVVAENVPVQVCTHCQETFSGPEAARIRHLAICRALGLLTPDEIRAIRERLGPSQPQFAKLTGIGEATISRWERGRLLQNKAMDRYLRLLDRNPGNVRILKELDPEGASNHKLGKGNLARAFWIFKYDPTVVQVEKLFGDPNPAPRIDWRVPQYSDRIRPNDIAFLWRTGPERGIVGVMRVEKAPEELAEADDLGIYVDPNSEEARRIIRKQPRAVGTLIRRNLDLRMAALKTEPGLENLSAFKPVKHTIFPVTPEEGNILWRLVEEGSR